jgi:tRNA (guanine10-N2)-dimethyltransferase
MAPLDARAYANLAGAGPGQTVLDPMCVTGGLLIEAGLAGSRVVGIDAQTKMVRGARENLTAYLDGDFAVVRGDGTELPVADDTVDGVVVDAPYGRQSKVAGHELDDLVAGALTEAARVTARCVLVGDRDWTSAARDAGFRLQAKFTRRVHRSLVRHVHVLDRTE